MKQIKYFLILATGLLISISVFSQQNLKTEYSKLIIGTWKLDSIDIGSFNLSPEYAEIVKQKLPEIVAMTEVNFGKHKKYSKKGFDGEVKGKWTISNDGAYVLIVLDGDTNVTKTKIIELNENKLIVAPDNDESANSKAYMYRVK